MANDFIVQQNKRFLFSRSKKHAARKSAFLLNMLFLKNEEHPSEKKLQSNVSHLKQSPYAKIQLLVHLFLELSKMAEKSRACSCLWPFKLFRVREFYSKTGQNCYGKKR